MLIRNILTTTDYDQLFTEQSLLNINPVCMDNRIFIDQVERDIKFPSLECLLGSQDGTLFVYDPLLIEPGRIWKFNHNSDELFHKPKRPVLINWVESKGDKNPTLFVATFEDGSIYIYDRELKCDFNESYSNVMVQINSNNG